MIVRGLIAAMLVSVSPSYVNFEIENQDVQSLYGRCKNPVGSPYYAFCLGYISGVGDDMQFLGLGTQTIPNSARLRFALRRRTAQWSRPSWTGAIKSRKRKKIEF